MRSVLTFGWVVTALVVALTTMEIGWDAIAGRPVAPVYVFTLLVAMVIHLVVDAAAEQVAAV